MPPIKTAPAEHDRQNLALLAAANNGDAKALSATIFAAWNDYDACLRTLIAHGADIHAKDNQGRTAAMLAAEYGSPDLAALTDNLALARDEASALAAATAAIPPSPRPPRI